MQNKTSDKRLISDLSQRIERLQRDQISYIEYINREIVQKTNCNIDGVFDCIFEGNQKIVKAMKFLDARINELSDKLNDRHHSTD